MASLAFHQQTPRQTPTPPPQAPSLSLDTSDLKNGAIPNKHLPYCSPGPAPYLQNAPATPPASPPTPQPEVRTSWVLHPPDAHPKVSASPPVFVIQPSTLVAAIRQSASQELPEPRYVFPWLHGLHPENQIQLAFFTARKKTLRNVPRCFRGVTIVKAGGNLTRSKVTGALAPEEILSSEIGHGDAFLDVDPKEGFSVRNFQIQATKMAVVSDIIVYRDNDVSEKELHRLAKRLSKAQDTWRVKNSGGEQEMPRFHVFILSCTSFSPTNPRSCADMIQARSRNSSTTNRKWLQSTPKASQKGSCWTFVRTTGAGGSKY